jgi:hypothetical protein
MFGSDEPDKFPFKVRFIDFLQTPVAGSNSKIKKSLENRSPRNNGDTFKKTTDFSIKKNSFR